jgi:SAM-dependent methyltransferase
MCGVTARLLAGPAIADQYAQGFAARWDELIDWDRRHAVEGRFLAGALTGAPGRRLIDIACGTGFHAALFARAGFQVDAADGSAEMVQAARANLGRTGLGVKVEQMDWAELAPMSVPRYDIAVCLGSSLPHARPAQRAGLLRRVHDLLVPGGVLLVGHRNFDHIVEHQAMPPGVSVYGGAVEVSLVAADPEQTTFGYRYADGFHRTLTVCSLRFDETRSELATAGFGQVSSFGDQRPVELAGRSGFYLHRAVRAAV